jgi:predicted MFS family arabinose efflux permease
MILPVRKPASPAGYRATVASLGTLLRRERILRINSIVAALVMAAFNVFRTAIASRLTSAPFHLSARGVAIFGLVGTAGAVSAPIMGRLGDRGWTRIASIAADLSVIAASLLALVAGGLLAANSMTLGVIGLFAAAILLDFGVIGEIKRSDGAPSTCSKHRPSAAAMACSSASSFSAAQWAPPSRALHPR